VTKRKLVPRRNPVTGAVIYVYEDTAARVDAVAAR
jgi:hypothetical protein